MNTALKSVIEKLAAAKCPEDLFGSLVGDQNDALSASYKFFARITHPDKNPHDGAAAAEAFKRIGEWRAKAEEKIRTGKYGDHSTMDPVTIKTKTREYVLTAKIADGAIADVYECWGEAVKVVRSPANNDLMMAEYNNTKAIHEAGRTSVYKDLLRHIPDMSSFTIRPEKAVLRVNVMKRFAGMVTLEDVVKRFPNGLDPRDAAWMINRALSALSVAHHNGIVHGAVLPQHVLINPKTHDGALIGWGASVKTREKLKVVDPAYRRHYPPWLWDNPPPVGPFLDVEMAATLFIGLVSGDMGGKNIPPSVPAPVAGVIRTCYLGPMHRPQNAALLQTDFYEALTLAFGPRKFRDLNW